MKKIVLLMTVLFVFTCCTGAKKEEAKSSSEAKEVCGPQAPRDIAQKEGLNEETFPVAPESKKLNLCNIHFHKNAEHKGPGFSVFKGAQKDGGYACNEEVDASLSQFKAFGKGACKGIEAGDTIEVHWVHSSCPVKPGPTLGACLSEGCSSPDLRVETQVFLLVNDRNAPSFADYTKLIERDGFQQAEKLPSRKDAVQFLGSTTGPKYNESCSPFKVNWSVTPACQQLDIASVHKWCEQNVFKEDHAHGVRVLVTDPKLLAPIK